jgi:hypothetical protein
MSVTGGRREATMQGDPLCTEQETKEEIV